MKKLLLALAIGTCCAGTFDSGAQEKLKVPSISISTNWINKVNPSSPLSEYPRPQMERKNWKNLNGYWQYKVTQKDAATPSGFNGKILVPYPIESALSGVKRPLKSSEALWYKRTIVKPATKSGERVLLNFGAVDFEATVFVNGKQAGKHTGGYQNFSLDITPLLKSGNNDLVVKVWDPSDKGYNPRGKQVLQPGGIMYTGSSGIWQTLWMEVVPAQSIESLKITPNVDHSSVTIRVNSKSSSAVALTVDGKTVQGISNTPIQVAITNPKLWSPDDPYLYDLKVKLGSDEVNSYFGMRKIEIKKDDQGFDRIFLNGKYTYNLGTLDQGFWPEGLHTAPTDEALKYDIQAIKAMGFNTIRKHIKIEPSRWYYWADKLGMLVWQDMVQPGNVSKEGKAEFEKENRQHVAQLYNHPSIISWVLFNESWGRYDQERLTKEMKQLDPTRLVNGHSGEVLYVKDGGGHHNGNPWISSDMADVHTYPYPGYLNIKAGKAAVIGEFGGIGVPIEGHLWNDLDLGWGYDGVVSPAKMKAQYTEMVDSLKRMERKGLTASIYTQPFDVESEQNGIMTYDRKLIKIPLAELQAIHASLWKPTANMKAVTADLTFNVAKADESYEQKLASYRSGQKDSALVRSLAILASANKDAGLLAETYRDYFKVIRNPFDEQNLKFIIRFARSSNDPGFKFLMANRAKVQAILGNTSGTAPLKSIIFNEEIKQHVEGENPKPDWAKLERELGAKYGETALDMLLSARSIHALNQSDFIQYVDVQSKIFKKYPEDSSAEGLNNMVWGVFENVDEKEKLREVIRWMTPTIAETFHAPTLDTYANLLYKSGNVAEAIKWQQLAVDLEPNEQLFAKTLEKMKSGQATWPIKK